MVTPSALIGWLYHDGEDKIRLSVLSRISAASSDQWWSESLSWLLFWWPIHRFRASLVWGRYAIIITCLLQWAFIHMGWIGSSMCAVKLLLQSMQPIAVIPSCISGPIGGLPYVSHVWSEFNEEDKLILPFLKKGPKRELFLVQLLLKLFWLYGALWTGCSSWLRLG